MANEKTPLLFLSHRIPYPPNKGDKIRSWHLLKHLSEQHHIFLGTFIDDPEDWQFTNQLEKVCKECCFIGINPLIRKIKSFSGFVNGLPLTLPYYSSKQLQEWVSTVITRHSIRNVIVYSSAIAQFICKDNTQIEKLIIDFVDVDSDKWQQYANRKYWPMKAVYKREANKLLNFDRDVAKKSYASFFVSESEAELFRSMAPESADKILHYNNGVDTGYFSPDQQLASPYRPGEKPIVFTGAMDYWPNIDAVCWFAKEILPLIRKKEHKAVFYIVGSKPSNQVKDLSKLPGIVVTGRVDDVRPYMQHSAVAIAPMRIARGVQNKVLEAMAMGKPVVCSPQALEGISTTHVVVAETPQEYCASIVAVLGNKYPELGMNARTFVKSDFAWESTLPKVSKLLKETHLKEAATVV